MEKLIPKICWQNSYFYIMWIEQKQLLSYKNLRKYDARKNKDNRKLKVFKTIA